MDIVIVESAFLSTDDLEACSEYATRCVRNSLLRGEAPFHVSLLYLSCLEENDAAGIEAANIAARTVVGMADRVAVYVDRGFTPQMRSIIAHANRLFIPVSYRSSKRPDADLPIAHIAYANGSRQM